MKSFLVKVAALLSLVFCSCETTKLTQVGFNSAIEHNSTGTTILHVDTDLNSIVLKGDIFLKEGSLYVELINSENDIVYSRTFENSGQHIISEKFNSGIGFWKLKYKSINGNGEIVLKMINQ